MNKIDLSAYKKNGCKFNHVAAHLNCIGLIEYKVGYKSTLERRIYNGKLPRYFEVMTFRQAVREYPEYFIL